MLPSEYPIDNQLLVDCESLGSGADIHDRNKYRASYRNQIRKYNESKNPQYYWWAAEAERLLRGVVAESKLNRFRILKGVD